MAEAFPDPVAVTFKEEGDKVYADWQQPGWDRIVEWNKEDRENRLQRTLDWGRQELVIPVGILHFLKKAIPELDSRDPETRKRAWKRFAADPVSLPFRVHGKGGFLSRSFGGLDDGGQRRGSDGAAESDVSAAPDHGGQADAGVCGGPAGPEQPPHVGDA